LARHSWYQLCGPAQNLFGRAGLVWRESKNATGFSGPYETDTDRLLVLEARLVWDHAGRAGGISMAEALIHQGVSTGATQIGATGLAAGNASFNMAAFTLSHTQQIGSTPWSVYGLAIGQAASDVLPDSERFSLGDATVGRGFAPGNTSGDAGYGGRVELHRLFFKPLANGAVTATEFYAFGDFGRAYDRAIERDGQKWETLASAGIGARIDINDWLTLTPEIARQITGVANDTTRQSHETRFYIGAVARF
jgi:hemolysin activation/secretion protein